MATFRKGDRIKLLSWNEVQILLAPFFVPEGNMYVIDTESYTHSYIFSEEKKSMCGNFHVIAADIESGVVWVQNPRGKYRKFPIQIVRKPVTITRGDF